MRPSCAICSKLLAASQGPGAASMGFKARLHRARALPERRRERVVLDALTVGARPGIDALTVGARLPVRAGAARVIHIIASVCAVGV